MWVDDGSVCLGDVFDGGSIDSEACVKWELDMVVMYSEAHLACLDCYVGLHWGEYENRKK